MPIPQEKAAQLVDKINAMVQHGVKPSDLLEFNRKAIRDIVTSHRGLNPRVFGSVVHGKDTDDFAKKVLATYWKEIFSRGIAHTNNGISLLLGFEQTI